MRRLTTLGVTATRTALAASLLSLTAFIGSAQAGEPIYRIDLNKTQILRLPASAGSIVIGNPAIADVTVHSPTTIFVVGRGYGETNLIILDRDGRTMMDANVQVTSITPSNGVRLFNAKSRETYNCSPYCQPSPVLGDNADFVVTNSAVDTEAPTLGSVFDQGGSSSSGIIVSPGEFAGGPSDSFSAPSSGDMPF